MADVLERDRNKTRAPTQADASSAEVTEPVSALEAEEGDVCAEDSGVGSFLDRFFPLCGPRSD